MSLLRQEQSLIKILRYQSLRLNSPQQIINAIKQLGKLISAGVTVSPDSFTVLIEISDFKKDSKTDSDSIITSEPHLSKPSKNYSAISALF